MIRKAILTGGGRATRLHPITHSINKHLLPLANKPMIFHAIEKVVEAGINEIYINTNPGETELQKYIGDGGHWGIKIHFFEQTGGPQGIAHVVNEAKNFIGDEPFMFYLSDNIFLGDLKEIVKEFTEKQYDCMLAFAKVPDPERFGVPVFDESGRLVKILEKPSNPPNNFAQTGVYLYTGKVFFEAFDKSERSPRGEYEISDIHTLLLSEGKNVGYKEITGWWKDTGKPSDLLLANQLLLEQMPHTAFSVNPALINPVTFQGNVHIGVGTKVGQGVTLIGPVIVGENCILENCSVGPNVTIGAGSELKNCAIENSIVLEGVKIHANISLTESILGKKSELLPKDEQRKKQRMLVADKTILEI